MTAAQLAGRRIVLVLGPSTGGIGQHVRSLRDALREAGAMPVCIGPADVLERFGFGSDGLSYEPHRLSQVWGLRTRLQGVDLVHAHGLRPSATTALTRTPAPLVATWHNAVLGGGAGRLRARPAERVVARRAEVSLCVSPDLVTQVFRLGGAARLSPVGATSLVRSSRSTVDLRIELGAQDRSLIVCIARLHHQKGLDVLVEAAAQLIHHPRRPLIVVAGEGPQRALLESRINDSGVPVRLLGHRTDVADLLAAADLAVLPSRWEGSSLAIHEVLAAGVPLIATCVGGVPRLTGSAARLVPPNDPAALADGMRELLDNPAAAAQFARRGRARAAEWPDSAATASAVLAVYAELLDRP